MLRLLESAFRRWWLCLLPILGLVGLGVFVVKGQSATYRSLGSVNVANTTLLGTLIDVRGNPGFGYDTPAVATSKQVNSLLQTDQFVRDVAQRAGFADEITNGSLTPAKLRSELTSWANGPNLLVVAASHRDPSSAQRLASATIDGFVDSVVTSNLGDSSAAQSVLGSLLTRYQSDVDAARSTVDAWLKDHPTPAFGAVRAEEDQAQFKRLNDALTQATDRYNATLAKSDSAQLAAQQAKSDVAQRLKVIDQPSLPVAPVSGLKAKAMTLVLFMLLGLLLAGAVVVMGALSDRSVRFADDVKQRLGQRLLTTVPACGVIPFAPRAAEMGRRQARRRSGPTSVQQAS